MLKATYQVLYASQWTMTDENTGEVRTGVTVWYLDNTPVNTPKERGVVPVKQSAPIDTWGEFHTVPGAYELSFVPRQGKSAHGGSQTTLKLTGASFVGTALPEKAAK